VAYILKYTFYLFNAGLAWFVWHWIRKDGSEMYRGLPNQNTL
jgi:hypothetical protein